jgi:hypothetical protein
MGLGPLMGAQRGGSRLTGVTLLGAVLASVVALGASVACLDVTPVTVSSPSFVDDASPSVDAPADVTADSAMDQRADAADLCLACLNTPDDGGVGCGTEVGACFNNPECAGALTCAQAKGCFENTSLKQIIACGYPCASEAGIISLNDPAVTLAFAVFQCVAGPCGVACNISGGD